ncbi:phosphate ABC transporter membrane protein 2, PhoT family [Moraxella cuniculi DSM 21768]|uniref:Phosphate transport system permease protein PstA n=2 Tax=Moraxella cuniculi TaxID=34061 RepID=A0A1N7FRH4_9GAMM|nr:phosphate ABC transporter permease PstA [Moraxella cuniculi]OOS08365.1 phosphate ABC transporter, permease protein PstA [Moraxella cuniculi]SIS02962.1 phosphate ABC transporter membrane protein 2, PhoT family [Moraxella cuniculi DSM 21768]VEG12740.1 Phosphate transport system permease protein pstA [Moraxella cuniculi]
MNNQMPAFVERIHLPKYHRRRAISRIAMAFAIAAMVFGLFWLAWILLTLLSHGIQGLMSMPVFSMDTPPPMAVGGVKNAIVGSLMICFAALFVGTPLGILTGVYLAEFDQGGLLGRSTRFINDILLSAPSIVIGLFVFTLMVQGRGFSGWAGVVALAIIVIPVVVASTENMLKLVPNSLREAAYALGTPRYKMAWHITLKSAKAGVITGVLLAFARIAGETAPLLFTALNNQYFSTDMSQAMANLPNTIYQFAMSPYDNWHALAWAAALLITAAVLLINIIARTLSAKSS